MPSGAKMVYSYDAEGQIKTIRDENHAVANIVHDYDERDRLFRVTQKQINTPGPDIVTTYGYDVHDNLVSVTDPNGNVTTYAYDDFGRMQRQTSPVIGVMAYAYDPAGNLTSTTDANGAITTRTFDALNRPLTSSSARSGLATEVVNWTYDSATAGAYGKGRAATMTDPSGSTTYAYERRGLLRSETRIILNISNTQAYGYDANGNRRSMTYPSGRVVSTTFDFAGRPFSASSGGTVWVSSATYEPFGPLSQLAFGNATTKNVTHDQRHRPLENRLSSGAGTVAEYDYTHDAAGNITAIADATNANYNRTFGYDDLNRLRTANTGSSLWGSGSFAYDAMGNTTSLALGTARTATFSYAGTTPKLTSVLEGTSRTVSYDAAGNETAVGSAGYSYSPRNLLASDDGLRYIYDGRGVRVVTVTTTTAANTAPVAPHSSEKSQSPSPSLELLQCQRDLLERHRETPMRHHVRETVSVEVRRHRETTTATGSMRWCFSGTGRGARTTSRAERFPGRSSQDLRAVERPRRWTTTGTGPRR